MFFFETTHQCGAFFHEPFQPKVWRGALCSIDTESLAALCIALADHVFSEGTVAAVYGRCGRC
jgi:hypothetical protein